MMCSKCNKEQIEQDRVKCSSCLFKEATNSKNYRVKHPNYVLSSRKLKKKYMAEGKCVSCGHLLNNDCDHGFITCINCREDICNTKQLR